MKKNAAASKNNAATSAGNAQTYAGATAGSATAAFGRTKSNPAIILRHMKIMQQQLKAILQSY